MKRLAFSSRFLCSLLALGALSLSACTERIPSMHASKPLTQPQDSPAARVHLVPTSLHTQAEFDAFVKDYTGRRAVEGLIAVFTLMADSADLKARPEDALLLQRLGVLHLERLRQPGHSQKLLDVAMRLDREAPDSPHTLFLNGYIPYVGLGGEKTRPPIMDARENAEMARVIELHWGRLVQSHPDYVGPNGFTATEVKQALAWLKKAQTPVEQTHVVASAGRPPHPLSAAELHALSEMTRFEQSGDGARRSLCRDWKRQRKADEQDMALVRLDLACAIQESQVDVAWDLIAKLYEEDGAAFDTCGAVLRLRRQVGEQAVALKQQSKPLTEVCP